MTTPTSSAGFESELQKIIRQNVDRALSFNFTLPQHEEQVDQTVQAILDLFEREVIGEDIDLEAYEEAEGDGVHISWEDNESEEVIGEKLAHYANFISDKTSNELRAQQRKRLREDG